ncbi:pleckstrin homology domain-containing family F member 2-like [Halichondria panicea]|uniref:pleckstrin homology domain-containing family F member 2-like n=1 Tax=Halichondria panicea TaxID=6063 RepID=UPI00312B5839
MADRLIHSEANSRRIHIVEQSFGSSGLKLVKPGRVLVGEGVLTKLCRKKAKLRQFYLFNDLLVYGNIVLEKKKFNKQHVVPLEDVKLQSLENDSEWKNGWQLITPTKSFAVFAATATEKAEWMAHINKCIVDLLARTNKQPAKEHAAVWVPDCDANTCMHCLKTKFTPINRRHHCRKCGAVVCGPCSSRKFLLPYQATKPLRVCISCYDALNAGEAEMERGEGSEFPPSTLVGPDNRHDYEASYIFLQYSVLIRFKVNI